MKTVVVVLTVIAVITATMACSGNSATSRIGSSIAVAVAAK